MRIGRNAIVLGGLAGAMLFLPAAWADGLDDLERDLGEIERPEEGTPPAEPEAAENGSDRELPPMSDGLREGLARVRMLYETGAWREALAMTDGLLAGELPAEYRTRLQRLRGMLRDRLGDRAGRERPAAEGDEEEAEADRGRDREGRRERERPARQPGGFPEEMTFAQTINYLREVHGIPILLDPRLGHDRIRAMRETEIVFLERGRRVTDVLDYCVATLNRKLGIDGLGWTLANESVWITDRIDEATGEITRSYDTRGLTGRPTDFHGPSVDLAREEGAVIGAFEEEGEAVWSPEEIAAWIEQIIEDREARRR